MDRDDYLKRMSQTLREAECRRRAEREVATGAGGAAAPSPAAKALERFENALRSEGLATDGERWQ